MACEDWKSLLSSFVDGEVAPFDETPLREHLSDCASCRKELEEIRLLSAILAARTAPDAAFISRFRARRDAELAGSNDWHRLSVRLLPLAAAAVLAASLAIWASAEREELRDLEASVLGNGLSISSEATLNNPFIPIVLEPFPDAEP